MSAASTIHPVILCGGAGTRLWPASRQSLPKPFVPLLGEQTLFQRAVALAAGISQAPPTIVTGEAFRFLVREQLGGARAAILIEPAPRSTAPAVLLAALHLAARDPDALMLVLPADQHVGDAAALAAAVAAAAPAALGGAIVTFGITPTRADTGFGYLELAGPAAPQTLQPVSRFVEKPDAETAAAFVAGGRHLWNAGIFLFRAAGIIAAFRTHAPEMLAAVRRVAAAPRCDLGFTRFCARGWHDLPAISIDRAIMEKAAGLMVMPFTGGWADLGDWGRVFEQAVPDGHGNVLAGAATAIDCSGSLIRSEAGALRVVGLGLADMLVIATADAVLVAPRRASGRVGEVVARLQQQDVPQASEHARALRPWGWYERIAAGERFQVKRILVKPGQSMSLQSHRHRAEHWVIVAGTARVTIGDQLRDYGANQSLYIPAGTRHRLANPGAEPILLIEVQTGAYLGEDDIVRHEDQYARCS